MPHVAKHRETNHGRGKSQAIEELKELDAILADGKQTNKTHVTALRQAVRMLIRLQLLNEAGKK